MVQDGEHAGKQVIMLAPSAPLNFLDFPMLVRIDIYRYYFAPGGKLSGKIEVGQTSHGLGAKAYAGGIKGPRLGLLGVNKEASHLHIPSSSTSSLTEAVD